MFQEFTTYLEKMTTLRKALVDRDFEYFVIEHEAEGVTDGDADKLDALTRRLSENPKSVQATSGREPRAG